MTFFVPQADTAARVQDSAAVLHPAPFAGLDSVVIASPLPGGVSAVMRVLFNLPQWFQIGGAVVGIIVAAVVLGLLWRRRQGIGRWIAGRDRGLQWALAGVLFVLLLAGAGASAYGWNYMQHDNGFCTGCHVMSPAYQEFVGFESKHDTLSCHDCHQQGMAANLRQLYLWVAERPDRIGPHAPVADAVCKNCHASGVDEKWQYIASTAGHRVHFESDSVALRQVMCVTCHGLEVHRFVPANRTCAQEGCHEPSQTEIVLGQMEGQTFQHCSQCHRFTADVPALALVDSARQTLIPAREQCLSCHAMQSVLADYNLARDPHTGQCGLCHNPHTQVRAGESVTTCASAGCHADWRDNPFHVGRAHRRTGDQCLMCHHQHAAKVDASDCEACHVQARARGGFRAPLPFDTAAALRPVSSGPHPDPPIHALPRHGPRDDGGQEARGKGDAPPEDDAPSGVRLLPALMVPRARQDTFRHDRHRTLACLTCHRSAVRHGELTFAAPRGCSICHHQAPSTSQCATCHQLDALRTAAHPTRFSIAVDREAPRERTVSFSHASHQELDCVTCHTVPVSLALAPEPAQCRGCHEVHHEPVRDCAACHAAIDLRTAHAQALGDRENASHQRCDACHTPATVALLEPRRAFCATCHPDQRATHYPDRECAQCHLLADPSDWRSRLFLRGGVP